MNDFLENFGLMAIFFVVIYGYKKILEYYDLKQSSFYENEKVYEAANEFAHGASSNEVKVILVSCFDFDMDDAEKILSRSIPHKTDKDGGYRAFIRSVNKILGEDVYSTKDYWKT